MADYTRNWAIEHGQGLFPEEGFESTTITCVRNQQLWNINQIYDSLLDEGFRMDRGYGKLRGKAFRIAHMGNIMLDDINDYLQHFDEVISG